MGILSDPVKFILIMLIIFIAVVSGCKYAPAKATEIQRTEIKVVDGDTVKINGLTFRLVGFDTPETFFSKCAAEFILGKKATDRLQEIIDKGTVIDIEEYGSVDKYKRQLGSLRVDNEDVGDILIGEGLAKPYNGRTKRTDWCALALE